jgi:hypothetical protein
MWTSVSWHTRADLYFSSDQPSKKSLQQIVNERFGAGRKNISTDLVAIVMQPPSIRLGRLRLPGGDYRHCLIQPCSMLAPAAPTASDNPIRKISNDQILRAARKHCYLASGQPTIGTSHASV